MHLFIEKGLRGGISTVCAKRYSEASPCLPAVEHHRPGRTQIMYLDANNLYGYAMCQELPHSGFKWLDLDKSSPDGPLSEGEKILECQRMIAEPIPGIGHLFEVDLHYPPELHDLHNSYPFAPEAKVMPMSRMSPYQLELIKKLNLSSRQGMKLLTT